MFGLVWSLSAHGYACTGGNRLHVACWSSRSLLASVARREGTYARLAGGGPHRAQEGGGGRRAARLVPSCGRGPLQRRANSHNMEEQTTTQRTIVASTELQERFLAYSLSLCEPRPVTVTISIVSVFYYYGYPRTYTELRTVLRLRYPSQQYWRKHPETFDLADLLVLFYA